MPVSERTAAAAYETFTHRSPDESAISAPRLIDMRKAMAVLMLVALTMGCSGTDGVRPSATTPTDTPADDETTPATGVDQNEVREDNGDTDLEGDIWFKPGDATFESTEAVE